MCRRRIVGGAALGGLLLSAGGVLVGTVARNATVVSSAVFVA